MVDTARRLIVARDEAVTEGERRIAAVERERGQLLATLEDVAARIAAHAALDGLDAGRPSGVVLSAEDAAAIGAAVREIRRGYERHGLAALNGEQRVTVERLAAAGWPLASKEGA